MCLTGGTGAQVVGEPPAQAPLTDLSSELLEPQGKPGWGRISLAFGGCGKLFAFLPLLTIKYPSSLVELFAMEGWNHIDVA